MGLNFLIHFWLRKERLVLLVVTEPSVADNVNEDIFFKLLSVLNCDLHAMVQKIWLVCVNVNDWSTNDFGNLGAVVGRSGLPRVGCKPNLVVHNNVDNSSRRIINQVLKLQRFINNALSRKCSISMNQNSHCFFSVFILQRLLDGSGCSINQGVNSLQMRRVGQHAQINFVSVVNFSVQVPQMIFHITRCHVSVRLHLFQKFFENSLGWLFENAVQRIESSSVGHTHHDMLNFVFGSDFDHFTKGRCEGIESLNTKSLKVSELSD